MLNELGNDLVIVSNGHQRKSSRTRTTREAKLRCDSTIHPMSLGCASCLQKELCGGLHIKHPPFDCLDFCCRKPESCDIVCRLNPSEYIKRQREVGGFALNNISRTQAVPINPLPYVIPVIFDPYSSIKEVDEPIVCLSLYAFLDRRKGVCKFQGFHEIIEKYHIGPQTRLLLTGTAIDTPLERWWGHGRKRIDVIQELRQIGVEMVTTPNFSLFVDRPRLDDLYSMKRIAITHEEFQRLGIRAALHVNARTVRDWERWAEYIASRAEIQDIAFEFATGGRGCDRSEWYVQQLCELATTVGHKLHLTVRTGRVTLLNKLGTVFHGVTVLDTNSYMKTVKRQKATIGDTGKLIWSSCPTSPDTTLDGLLRNNIQVFRDQLTSAIESPATQKHIVCAEC